MSVAEDIGQLKADMRNVVSRIDRLAGYMERSDDWRDKAGNDLTILVECQKRTEQYQDRCDRERNESTSQLTQQDKRISACEGFQGRLVKTAIAVTGVGSLSSPWLSKIWERIFS